LISNGRALIHIEWAKGTNKTDEKPENGSKEDVVLDQAERELSEYFAGKREDFEVPIEFADGTTFQKNVWKSLRKIPYGKPCSYKDVAVSIGKPCAARAVGRANSKNPIPIIVPCHRVISSDGTLGGFTGGLVTKKKLLALEGVTIKK
jgi:O-6-methylguanine DNA methyltransferase